MTRKIRFVTHRKRFLRKWMDHVRARLRITRGQLADMLGVSESSINVTIYAMSGNVPTHVTVCRYALTLHKGMKDADQLTQQVLEAYGLALLKDMMEEDAAGVEPKSRTRFKKEPEDEQVDDHERSDPTSDAPTADCADGEACGEADADADTETAESNPEGTVVLTLPDIDPVPAPWEVTDAG